MLMTTCTVQVSHLGTVEVPLHVKNPLQASAVYSESNPSTFLRLFLLLVCLLAAARAQVPVDLKSKVLSPSPAGQRLTYGGWAVATDGTRIVTGAINAHITESFEGIVHVFTAESGALEIALNNPTPAGFDSFGKAVAISADRVVVGVPDDDTGATNAGSVYVFDLSRANPKVPFAVISNPTPVAEGHFGGAIAIEGARLFVGAPGAKSGTSVRAGIVYEYDLSQPGPIFPRGIFDNPSPAMDEYFGTSLALNGSQLAVGAPGALVNISTRGSAYVYDLSVSSTAPVAQVDYPRSGADQFGCAVALAGQKLAVGASMQFSGAGIAYVYDLGSSTPGDPVLVLNSPEPGQNQFFASSLALSGKRLIVGGGATSIVPVYDLTSATPSIPEVVLRSPTAPTATGYGQAVGLTGSKAVVGAYRDGAGKTYTYDLASATPGAVDQVLSTFVPSDNDYFGLATAISGFNLIVGAHYDDAQAIDAGAAYVFPYLNGGQPTPLVNPVPEKNDFFGRAVAIFETRTEILAIVGAPGDHVPVVDAGAAFVYTAIAGNIGNLLLSLPNPEPASGDEFGSSVAVSGIELSPSESRPLIAIGAPSDDAAGTDSGSVYIYAPRDPNPETPLHTLRNPRPSEGKFFGNAVALDGSHLIVGARGDQLGTDAGFAYIYDLASANPTLPTATLLNPEPAGGDLFGQSVAIEWPFVVVAATTDDLGASDAGSVYVYNLSGIAPLVPIGKLRNPAPSPTGWFGSSLALSNGKLIVGSARKATGTIKPGAAYVYQLAHVANGTPSAVIANPAPSDLDYFGNSVSLVGEELVVGAYFEDDPAQNRGAVYTYKLGDVETDPLVLISPLSGVRSKSPLPIEFTLFERASSLKVTLANESGEWVAELASEFKEMGTHRLLLNMPDLSATAGVISASGGPLPDGTYNVTVSYSDLQLHPEKSAAMAGITVDSTPPTVTASTLASDHARTGWARDGNSLTLQFTTSELVTTPVVAIGGKAVIATGGPQNWTAALSVTSDLAEGPVALSIATEDLFGNVGTTTSQTTDGSSVAIDRTAPVLHKPDSLLVLAPTLDGVPVSLDVTATDNLDANVNLVLNPASGSLFPLGVTIVTTTATDAAGNSSAADFPVTIRLEDTVKRVIFATGEAVPGAAAPESKIPAGATWAELGYPSVLGILEHDAIAGFLGAFSTPGGKGSGIFTGTLAAPVAHTTTGEEATDSAGVSMAGVVFKSFKEPVFATADEFAFLATVRGVGVSSQNGTGIWARNSGGLYEVARQGAQVPNDAGISFAAFGPMLMPAADRLYFQAILKGRGVVKTNDSSLWFWSKTAGLQLVQREGTASPSAEITPTVKSFRALDIVAGSPGHGRYAGTFVPGLLTLADKTQLAVAFDGANILPSKMATGFEVEPDVAVSRIGFPSLFAADSLSARAEIETGTGVEATRSPVILRETGPIVRAGAAAPGVIGASFVDFGDPVTEIGVDGTRTDLFPARLAGNQVKKGSDESIWLASGAVAPALILVAREGDLAPSSDGALFKKFISISLMRERGPLFTASLAGGSPPVKNGTDEGLWGTDFSGSLRLLLREGGTVAGKVVKRFEVLSAIPGSAAQQRSWSKEGSAKVLVRCSYTDGTRSIVELTIP
jgi:hypothetical protein